ncbi:MAG: geranylgeranylglycerol-phosphate geranylgeranyltransferase [Bacteroidota bacterium]
MYFLRLIRPINLLIIVLTMYGAILYLFNGSSVKLIPYSELDFGLLVFSTVLIAAAGNIINDYFDVKADKVNKPDRLIITKHIKRRWAIFWHWTFNCIGFFIGIYLSIKYQSLSFVFVQLMSINLLWFYSMYFKRKMLIGNVIISFLSAMIPILVVIFYHFSMTKSTDRLEDYTFIFIMAGFAFVLNFAREIIKDIQDIEGDKLIQVRSLPMIVGINTSLVIAGVLLCVLPALMIIIWFFGAREITMVHAAALVDVLAILVLIFASQRLKIIDQLIKLTMLIGLLMFYQLAFL